MISGRLRDMVSIITGGSMGIGREIAGAYAMEGSQLLLVARTPGPLELAKEQLRTSGARVEVLAADVGIEGDVRRIVGFCMEKFSRVNVLVNAAGVYGPIGLATEVSAADWMETIRVNLFGPFLCVKAVAPMMIRQGGGKIINFSGGGATTAFPRFSAYAASKAAVVRLTETLAEEFKDFGIQINVIAPGPVNTRLLDQVLAAGERAGRDFLTKAKAQANSGGTPAKVVLDLATFLASPESKGLTGKLISAVWDDWRDIPNHVEEIMNTDVYTLRRIVPHDRGLAW